ADCGTVVAKEDDPGPDKTLFYKGVTEQIICPEGHVLRKELPQVPEGVEVKNLPSVEGTTPGLLITCKQHIANPPKSWTEETGFQTDKWCEPTQCPTAAIERGKMTETGVFGGRAMPECDIGYAGK
ncbi:unnamed protein product, partial [Amoebophrya sp. A25]